MHNFGERVSAGVKRVSSNETLSWLFIVCCYVYLIVRKIWIKYYTVIKIQSIHQICRLHWNFQRLNFFNIHNVMSLCVRRTRFKYCRTCVYTVCTGVCSSSSSHANFPKVSMEIILQLYHWLSSPYDSLGWIHQINNTVQSRIRTDSLSKNSQQVLFITFPGDLYLSRYILFNYKFNRNFWIKTVKKNQTLSNLNFTKTIAIFLLVMFVNSVKRKDRKVWRHFFLIFDLKL